MRQTVKSVVNIEEVINNLTSTTVIVRDNKSYKKLNQDLQKQEQVLIYLIKMVLGLIVNLLQKKLLKFIISYNFKNINYYGKTIRNSNE